MMEIQEKDLREALGSERPNPADFRRSVERKLVERESEMGASADSESEFKTWRTAAGMLPLGWFDSASMSTVVPGKAAGGKTFATLLAWPAISLAMAGLSILLAVRAILGLRMHASEPQDIAQKSSSEYSQEWWRENAIRACVTLVVLVAVAMTQPLEAVILTLLVCIFSLVNVLRHLAARGAASRQSVGEFAAGLLGGLVALSLLPSFMHIGHGGAAWFNPWVPFVLLVGSNACDIAGRWSLFRSVPRLIICVGLPLAILSWVGLRIYDKRVPLDQDRLREFVEGFDRDLKETVEWRRFGEIAEWLGENEATALDMSRARSVVNSALNKTTDIESILSGSGWNHSLLSAVRAGIFPASRWSEFWVGFQGKSWMEGEGALLRSTPTEWLVHTRLSEPEGMPLDEEGKAKLARRFNLVWPKEASRYQLEAMDFILRMNAKLGNPVELGQWTESAHAALLAHWQGTGKPEMQAAGFRPEQEPNHLKADIHLVRPTGTAIRLMERFGVPKGIHLEAVEAFLRRAATPSLVEALAPAVASRLSVQSYRLEAEVALRQLQRLQAKLGVSSDSQVEPNPFWRYRAVWISMALVLLCLLATLRAPVGELSRSRFARE